MPCWIPPNQKIWIGTLWLVELCWFRLDWLCSWLQAVLVCLTWGTEQSGMRGRLLKVLNWKPCLRSVWLTNNSLSEISWFTRQIEGGSHERLHHQGEAIAGRSCGFILITGSHLRVACDISSEIRLWTALVIYYTGIFMLEFNGVLLSRQCCIIVILESHIIVIIIIQTIIIWFGAYSWD